MENYISLLLATLTHLKLLTEEEAVKVDKKLRESTIPGTFKEAQQTIKDIFDSLEKK